MNPPEISQILMMRTMAPFLSPYCRENDNDHNENGDKDDNNDDDDDDDENDDDDDDVHLPSPIAERG